MPDTRSRRPEETSAAMLHAARRLFAERGYTGASVRDIAAAAAVDPAVVIRRFGSKEQLFLRVMEMRSRFGDAFEGPVETLGERLLWAILGPGDAFTRTAYTALVGASDRPEVRQHLHRTTDERLVERLVGLLTGPDARLRAVLVAAQIGGLLDALWVSQDPELVAADVDELVATYGKALQALIDR